MFECGASRRGSLSTVASCVGEPSAIVDSDARDLLPGAPTTTRSGLVADADTGAPPF